ncbi:hypothetical protein EVAR_27122_1 [Eumeta japonica]|uniref:Uncharacterized protein n=1 Tax=Eumeta variegata TaxID=151549 RepID=A0A4C1W1B5_EUMVA|nr:hypothetical protein EVAR_27122_1 [Eumeta japonica]
MYSDLSGNIKFSYEQRRDSWTNKGSTYPEPYICRNHIQDRVPAESRHLRPVRAAEEVHPGRRSRPHLSIPRPGGRRAVEHRIAKRTIRRRPDADAAHRSLAAAPRPQPLRYHLAVAVRWFRVCTFKSEGTRFGPDHGRIGR